MTKKIKQETKKQDVKYVIYNNEVHPCIVLGEGIWCRVGLYPDFQEEIGCVCQETVNVQYFQIFNTKEEATNMLLETRLNHLANDYAVEKKRFKELITLFYIFLIFTFILNTVEVVTRYF